MFKKLIDRIRHEYYNIFKMMVFGICVILVVLMMPRSERFQYTFLEGKPWMHEKLMAPFDFPIQKSEEQLNLEHKQITEGIQPYFVFDQYITDSVREILSGVFDEKWQTKYGNGHSQQKQLNLDLIQGLYDTIQQVGIIKHHPVLDNKPNDFIINIVRNREASLVAINQLFSLQTAYNTAINHIKRTEGIDRELLTELIEMVLQQNVVYDERLTNAALTIELNKLTSTYGLVQFGELIIDEGEVVDTPKYRILNSLRNEYQSKKGSALQQRTTFIGHLLLTSIIFLILFVFIKLMRPDVFDELRKLNLILLVMMFLIVSSFLIIGKHPTWIWYIPFGIIPIIMITFFDTRLTLLIHLLTILTIAFVIPNAFEFLFLQLVIGYVVIFSLMKHNKRIYFFRTSIFLFITYSVVYTGFNLINVGGFESFDYYLFAAFAVSSLLTLLALPIIFLLERLFGMITDLTLLELSNTNSPLLRKLALIAPGTFQHSMQVANLSEEALFEIGGDTLLARTGALYHDIGKMDNPTYFIENQMGGYNPHDDISFAESARIIIEHVTLGIEKARKAGLPEQIIDFIRTHHGNRRVEYFYILEQKQNPGLELDDRDFSYRGPIPFSKETAVVMMADSVEAASRSMKNPTEQKISDLVENIISRQLETKQFINANITLKEVDVVKKILKKKLMNIYHVRIAYPS